MREPVIDVFAYRPSSRMVDVRKCSAHPCCTAFTLLPSSDAGATTTLADTVFSTVPGAPVFVGKAPRYKSKNALVGIDLDIKGHNALQSTFVFQS